MSAMGFLLGVVATLVICELAPAAAVTSGASCRQVTEAADLDYRITELSPSCNMLRISNSSLMATSPILNRGDCAVSLWTNEPSFMEILPVVLDVESDMGEFLRIKTILGTNLEFTMEDLNRVIAPVTQNTLYYNAEEGNEGVGFAFMFTAKSSSCSYVCDLAEYDSGEVSVPAYEANTYCQTWFTAPQGCRVKLFIDSMNIGTVNEVDYCVNDYLVVAVTGEPAFPETKSQAFCGEQANLSVESEENMLMFVLNGRVGGYSGFHGRYEVVCP